MFVISHNLFFMTIPALPNPLLVPPPPPLSLLVPIPPGPLPLLAAPPFPLRVPPPPPFPLLVYPFPLLVPPPPPPCYLSRAVCPSAPPSHSPIAPPCDPAPPTVDEDYAVVQHNTIRKPVSAQEQVHPIPAED